MVLEAIKYERGSLKVLDQLQLPHLTVFDKVETSKDAWESINSMRVRGAPAIAIVAALGLAVELNNQGLPKGQSPDQFINERLDYLVTSRPTAVNLGGAAKLLKGVVSKATASGQDAVEAYIKAAEQMLIDDVKDNKAIGENGADWILKQQQKATSVSLLTHCNTGSLATAGYGTALGVIRSVHQRGRLDHAFCTETRPYNQGARLTAYELVHDQIPSTLITDSMASALLKSGDKNVVAIVVGADRVAFNGDTANKIGTYNLAITAKFHGVKFVVAAPRTTIDLSTASGDSIQIEQRKADELTSVRGPCVSSSGKVDLQQPSQTIRIAADGINVWNPAFDITPASLIDAIVTEVGVLEKNAAGQFDLESIM